MTATQLKSFVAQLVAAVTEEVQDGGDRERLRTRLNGVAEAIGQEPADIEPAPGWLGSTGGSPQCDSLGARLRLDPSHPALDDDASDETDFELEP